MAKKRKTKRNFFKCYDDKKMKNKNCMSTNCGGGIYGLGFIGALIYYIQTAPTFWVGALGVLKALVWPAIFVYKILGFLG